VSDRVDFQVMDALLILEFPKGYFDLVNLRSATSFMRTWNWPKLLSEMQRVARPGGVIRITEALRMHSNSPAVIRLMALFGEAFFNAGHLFSEVKTEDTFTEGSAGIANDLARLLDQYGVHNIQTRISTGRYLPGTPTGQQYIEDLQLSGKNMLPFVRKWGRLPDDYDTLCQEALDATQRPDFSGSWDMLTAWGTTTI
jgi:SAM-dependent methyltransferase